MPTRKVLPSPSRVPDAEVPPSAASPLPWGAGPQPARNIIPPTLNAAMPESFKNSLRERMTGCTDTETVS